MNLGPRYGKHMFDVLFFLGFHCTYDGFGCIIIPKRLQYFFGTFLERPKSDQIWTLGPRIYRQNTSKTKKRKMQETYGTSLEIFFSYLIIWNSESWGRSTYQTFWNFVFFTFANLDLLNFHFKHVDINSELEHLKFGNLKYEISKFWKCEESKTVTRKCWSSP